jgi:hypothetical protein
VLLELKPEPVFILLDEGDDLTSVLGFGAALSVDGEDVYGLVNVTLASKYIPGY